MRNVDRKEVLFREGLSVGDIGVIHKGWFKQVMTSEAGEHIVDLKFPGDVVGVEGLINGHRYTSSIISMAESEVCLISSKAIRELMAKEGKVGTMLTAHCIKSTYSAYQRVPYLTCCSTMCRIATILEKVGKVNPSFNFSREDLASYVGATRETVTRNLGLLKRDGAIDIDNKGRITIANSRTLSDYITLG